MATTEPIGNSTKSSTRKNQATEGASGNDAAASATSRRATGPRTGLGKERSKRNATKYGIFSSVAVLSDEARPAFNTMLSGLREHFRPEGAIEHLLVDKLATYYWRHRRVLVAEEAEIRKAKELAPWKEQNPAEQQSEIEMILKGKKCLENVYNPVVLEKCIAQNEAYRSCAQEFTSSFCQHADILEKRFVALFKDEKPDKEDVDAISSLRETEVLLEIVSKLFSDALDRDLQLFSKRRDYLLEMEAARLNVPNAPTCDRLIRYEAFFERAIDRTLTQLERLQRIRRGQPVPLPFKVTVAPD
jgi:hypothetical protein